MNTKRDDAASAATDCSTLAKFMSNVVGEVGIFGTLAVLHDYFDRNLSRYETYPVIQRELRRFDRELRVAVEAVDPVIDREVAEEAAAERRYQHQITELIDRDVNAPCDCSLALTPQEEAELQDAMAAWIPWWCRPESQEEWDKLVEQRATFAASAINTHKRAIESGMPRWFIEKVAKARYQQVRKYKRTKRRAEIVRRWPTWSREERLLAMIKYDL